MKINGKNNYFDKNIRTQKYIVILLIIHLLFWLIDWLIDWLITVFFNYQINAALVKYKRLLSKTLLNLTESFAFVLNIYILSTKNIVLCQKVR